MKNLYLFIICLIIKTIESSLELSVNVTTDKSAEIKWRTDTDKDIIGYNLTIVPLSPQDKVNLITMVINVNDSLPVSVGGLTPGAQYTAKLEVISFNSTTVSTKNFTIKPCPPDSTLFCHYSVQSIHVMWDPPNRPCIFDIYRASIEPDGSPSSVQFIERNQKSAVFNGLTPGRAYTLSVQTDSKNILSEPLTLECRTTPSEPTYLWYDPNTLSSYSFDIQWGPPRLLTEFDTFLLIKNDILYKKIPKDEPRFAHFSGDLKPGKTYKIEVNTRSELISSKSVVLNVTTRPLPIIALKPKPGNLSDIYVEWTVSTNSTQDSFLVTFWELNAYVLKESVRVINRTSTHLYNLLSGRNYSIAVVAVSNNISSLPMIVYQPTRPAPPKIDKLEQTSDQFLNISWKTDLVKSELGYYKIMWTRADTNETKVNIVRDYWALLYVYPGAKYEINISAINHGLKSPPSSYSYLIVPRAPYNIHITYFNTTSVGLSWSRPNDSLVDYYIVRYRPFEAKEWLTSQPINTTNFDIKVPEFRVGDKYSVRVTAVVNGTESSNKRDVELRLDPNSLDKDNLNDDDEQGDFVTQQSQNKTLIIILIVMTIMALCIIGPGLYMYYIRGKWAIQEQVEEKDLGKPETKPLTTEKDDQDNIDESILIDRNEIKILQQIGQGQFGSVHFGTLTVRSGRLSIPIAIKMSNIIEKDRDMKEFLKEALIMKNFSHENVLTLIGVSFESDESPLVVLPFMKNGDLLSYVRSDENQPTVRQLMRFAIDVAKGMEYLSDQHFIHRDLAARNCMLDNDLTVKVADFGLSKHMISKDYYKTENQMQVMPIKWMSIESLEKGIYNTKTDVWSYGVLVWELMTRGINPYPNLQHFEVLPHLRSGYRLQKPNYCPDLVFELLEKCWSFNPKVRPTFTEISVQLNQIIDSFDKITNTELVKIDNITYYNQPISYSLSNA